jgi:hypothetical protein
MPAPRAAESHRDTLLGFPFGNLGRLAGVIRGEPGVVRGEPGVIAITPEMTPVSLLTSTDANDAER